MTDSVSPDFDAIKRISPYNAEYWSARELARLLGYKEWRNFESAIKRAQTSCTQTGQNPADHFMAITRTIKLGSGAEREVSDFYLSRMAAYLIAENGDPRKPEIAAAQVYFAVAARENELRQLKEAQDERLRLRLRVADNNEALNEAAYGAGVLPGSFGTFHNAGYKAMYGGLNVADIKEHKGIGRKRICWTELGAPNSPPTIFGSPKPKSGCGRKELSGRRGRYTPTKRSATRCAKRLPTSAEKCPEDLPAEPTIRPLLAEQQRKRKKLEQAKKDEVQPDLWDQSSQ